MSRFIRMPEDFEPDAKEVENLPQNPKQNSENSLPNIPIEAILNDQIKREKEQSLYKELQIEEKQEKSNKVIKRENDRIL